MPRLVISVTNDAAGGAINPAIVNVDCQLTAAQSAANMIAFLQFCAPAATTKVTGIQTAPIGGGAGTDLPWSSVGPLYNALQTADSRLIPMADYGVAFGSGGLAVLGSGAVVARHTATAGRSGRGRFTTPWLGTAAVSGSGNLDSAYEAVLQTAAHDYMLGGGAFAAPSILPVLWSHKLSTSTAITRFSVSTRLGRMRSRTA